MDSSNSSDRPRVSVIIPARDEESNLRRLIPALQSLEPAPEIVVAEAGSSDRTRQVSQELGAKVSVSLRGRGHQLNAGAKLSQGDVLLFLHADSVMTPPSWEALHSALSDPALEGGAFRFSLAGSDGFWPRVYEFFVDLRSRWLGLPYGDQGYFVRRATWEQVGPFDPLPLMEDVQWWGRLQRQARIQLLRAPLTTSDRRFRRRGFLASAARNLSFLSLWKLGVSPHRIHRWYT